MGDTVLRSIHQIGQAAPGIYVYVEAVLLFATALVSYASELHPPGHVTLVLATPRNPRETVHRTSRSTAHWAIVTTATFFNHTCYLGLAL